MSGRYIMVVEDEPLVAMVLEKELEDLGLSVAGVCGSVAEAIRLLDRQTPEAAILDVNLGGELVYPVAEALLQRNIPFVFITGYGQESIDKRFSSIRVLEKPVERDVLRSAFRLAANSHDGDGSAQFSDDTPRRQTGAHTV
jgi:CheY-like chemotaxis protein